MADRNAGKCTSWIPWIVVVLRHRFHYDIQGFPRERSGNAPIKSRHVASSWGDRARSFWPIYKVTKLPFRASDNSTFQTVKTLQNSVIHNAQNCSYLMLKIALFENFK